MYRLIIVCVLAMAPMLNSYAQKTVDIYNSEELVLNKSSEIRQKAASKALKTVLIRLSGDNAVYEAPELNSAIKRATDFLDRYSYQSTDETLTIAGAEQSATLLSLQFNAKALKQLLKQSLLPIWSESRPEVLVWVATDRRGKKVVDNDSGMARSLLAGAESRGLPIVFPVLDLEDRTALPVKNLWALDDERIITAAQRYETNAVLSGRFSLSNKKWTGSFILFHLGKTTYLTAKGNSRWKVARSIMDNVTDHLAGIYAVNFDTAPTSTALSVTPPLQEPNETGIATAQTIGASGEVLPSKAANAFKPDINDPRVLFINIDNVSDFNEYVLIMNYLENSSLVDNVKIAKAKNPSLLLQIKLLTDKEKFFATLDLDNRLQRIASSGNSVVNSSGQTAFDFVWR